MVNTLCHVMPFATWMALQMTLPATAWAYAVRAGAAALAGGVAWRLMRPRLAREGRSLVWGLLAGLVVWALWVLPELSAWYRTWCVLPLGAPPAAPAPSPYDPAVCGWPLTVAKLLGSAFVIAPAEELFFRSFLYRRLQARDFTSVPLAHFDLSAFLWVVFLFTLEHDRPLAAASAGVVYGLVAIRFGLVAAIVAHVTTNFVLALQVIGTQAWWFW